MLRVQTTISMGENYIERVLEVDDPSKLTPEERAAIIYGAICPIAIDVEDTGSGCTSCAGGDTAGDAGDKQQA